MFKYILPILFIASVSEAQLSNSIDLTDKPVITTSTTGIDIKSDDGDMRIYAKDGNILITKVDENIFKFEKKFTVKPATNSFYFDIDGSDKYDFYYQPELTEEQKQTSYRPENVIGSYAVYCEGRKIFHIYRARFIDNKGDWIWGNMYYDGKRLRIIVNQGWLDNAEYPVLLDPTLGYTSIGGSDDFGMNGIHERGGAFVAPENGTCTGLVACIWNAVDAADKDRFCLWDFVGGHYDLVANSYTGDVVVPNQAKPTDSSTFTDTPIIAELIDGHIYWIGITQDEVAGGNSKIAYDSGETPVNWYELGTNYVDFPQDPFDSANNEQDKIHTVYVTYTPDAEPQKRRRIIVNNQ